MVKELIENTRITESVSQKPPYKNKNTIYTYENP